MFMIQVIGINKAEFAFDVTTEKTNIEISFLYYERVKIWSLFYTSFYLKYDMTGEECKNLYGCSNKKIWLGVEVLHQIQH